MCKAAPKTVYEPKMLHERVLYDFVSCDMPKFRKTE